MTRAGAIDRLWTVTTVYILGNTPSFPYINDNCVSMHSRMFERLGKDIQIMSEFDEPFQSVLCLKSHIQACRLHLTNFPSFAIVHFVKRKYRAHRRTRKIVQHIYDDVESSLDYELYAAT